ncbi:MAG: diacylglycerol kinase family protein [Eubacteriales bacterium]|nr:diacylglycerol kinase family protein [Eubacteriales bacterium]
MPEKDTRHYFIFNPAAGRRNTADRLSQALAALEPGSFTLYTTKAAGDAVAFVRAQCGASPGAKRFYACGGDGTLGEVATGALGFPEAEIGVWPCGSGNDYVKYFGGGARFLDLGRQVEAKSVPVDLMQAGDRCAINAINLGLEAEAAATMVHIRHHPLFNGKNGYILGVLNAVARYMRTDCEVTAEGEKLHSGAMLTLSLACGKYIGGGFMCAPRSQNDDGFMELALVQPMSRLRLARLIGAYKKGEHLGDPRMRPFITYRRVKEAMLESDRDIRLCLDGEIITGRRFEVKLLPAAARFIVPEAV